MNFNCEGVIVNTQDIRTDRVVRATALVFLFTLLTIILKSLAFLFIPLIISLLCCYVLGFPLDLLKRLRIPGWLRIVIVIFLALIFIYLLGTLVEANVRQFQERFPEFEKRFWEYAGKVFELLNITPEQAKSTFSAFVRNIQGEDLKPIGTMVQWMGGSFFSILGNIIGVLLYMVFMLPEREVLPRRILAAMGEEKSVPVLDSVSGINKAVRHYLGLKTLISLMTGALVSLMLWALGVPFALLWGVLAFVLNFIPNIGSLLAAVPPIAVALFHFGSFGKTLIVAGGFAIIQVVMGSYLEPKLMGKGLNLSPLCVLLALVFWGWLWGITGMLLSVPLTAALRIAMEQLESTRPLAVLMSDLPAQSLEKTS